MTLPNEVCVAVGFHRMLFQTRKVSTSPKPLQLRALFFVKNIEASDVTIAPWS